MFQKERHAEKRVFLFGFRRQGRLHPPVIEMLGRSEFALRQGFRPRRKRLYGAKAPPRRAGPHVLSASILFRPCERALCTLLGLHSSFCQNKRRALHCRTLRFALPQRPHLACTLRRGGDHAPPASTAARAALMRVISIGFAMCPFMPAARAAAMSSSKALAVMARMGMEAASGRSSCRISRVAP